MRRAGILAGMLTSGALVLPLLGSLGAAARVLRVEPQRVEVTLGARRQLRVRGASPGAAVKWQVVKGVGSVSEAGVFTAPARAGTPITTIVRAEAAGVEPSEARVLIPAVRVQVQAERSRLRMGEACRLRALVDRAEDTRVEWSVEGGQAHGEVTSAGLYTTPLRHETPATVVVRATSVADPSKSAVAALQLEAVTVEVRPHEARVRMGETRRFDAAVRGAEQGGVRWTVAGEGRGTISPSGLYTPPDSLATPTVVVITATSEADPTKVAQARVTISEVGLSVTPAGVPRSRSRGGPRVSATVYRVVRLSLPLDPLDQLVRFPFFRGRSGKIYVPLGGAYQFQAKVDGTEADVHWSLEGGPDHGSISDDGLYRAPDRMITPQVVRVVAQSAADPSRRAAATLHIPPVYLEGGPRRASVPLGGAVSLDAQVRNSENDRVRWLVEGGTTRGTVSPTGLIRPAEPLTTPTTLLVRAVSEADESKSLAFEVIVPEVTVKVSPGDAKVRAGETLRVYAQVRGALNGAVRWTLDPQLGTISAGGTYSAPADLPHESEVEVRATSVADPTKSGRAVIRVLPLR